MRLGKTILPEALDLPEYLPGKLFLITALTHTLDQFVLERSKSTAPFPGRHCAPELVGFTGSKAGSDNRQLHDLLLEDRHPQRPLQYTFDGVTRVIDSLLAVSPSQVRVHHVALNGSGPNNRNLDNKIVVTPWPETRQHRHLCARLDLEYAHRVTATNHVVDKRVFCWHRRQCQLTTVELTNQIEATTNRGQHPEPEHIHFEQTEIFEIHLLPLDNGAIRHRRVFHRHEF